MKKIILLFLLAFSVQFIFAQTVHKHLRQGNKSYQEENYDEAAEAYHKALEKDPSNIKSKFNLGNATYNSKGYDESIKNFSSAAQLADDDKVKANAFYNLGNSFFQKAQGETEEQQKILEQSVEAYKNSLRLNPKDEDAKKNLALTQRYIRKMQQQQQQQQQQNQDQEKKEEQKDKKEQDQENQDQQQQQNQNQDQQDQSDKPKDGEPKEEKGKDLSKEEAMELLKIMDEEEKKVQEKMRKAKSKGKKKPEKDW